MSYCMLIEHVRGRLFTYAYVDRRMLTRIVSHSPVLEVLKVWWLRALEVLSCPVRFQLPTKVHITSDDDAWAFYFKTRSGLHHTEVEVDPRGSGVYI